VGLRGTVWASSIAPEQLYAKWPVVKVVISGTKSPPPTPSGNHEAVRTLVVGCGLNLSAPGARVAVT